MTMTNEEIVRHYRQADDKAADIKVLADLNVTGKDEIIGILEAAGEKIPGRSRGSKLDGKIKPLYEQGLNDAEIVGRLGCTAPTIANWRRRNGLPVNKGSATKEAGGQLPDIYTQLEKVLAALPEGSSEFVRRSARDFLCDMLAEYLNRRLGLGGQDG